MRLQTYPWKEISGFTQTFPIVTLSIAIVTNKVFDPKDIEELSSKIAELYLRFSLICQQQILIWYIVRQKHPVNVLAVVTYRLVQSVAANSAASSIVSNLSIALTLLI